MIRYLLDVNVLISLIDPAHVQHDQVHEWFGRVGHKACATCPITENGLLRIVGHPKYPNSPGPPSAVVAALTAIRNNRSGGGRQSRTGSDLMRRRLTMIKLRDRSLPGDIWTEGAGQPADSPHGQHFTGKKAMLKTHRKAMSRALGMPLPTSCPP